MKKKIQPDTDKITVTIFPSINPGLINPTPETRKAIIAMARAVVKMLKARKGQVI